MIFKGNLSTFSSKLLQMKPSDSCMSYCSGIFQFGDIYVMKSIHVYLCVFVCVKLTVHLLSFKYQRNHVGFLFKQNMLVKKHKYLSAHSSTRTVLVIDFLPNTQIIALSNSPTLFNKINKLIQIELSKPMLFFYFDGYLSLF